MSMIRQRVTQSGADTFTAVALALPALDGKSGYQFNGLEVYSTNGNTIAAVDFVLNAELQVQSTVALFTDDELIARIGWGVQNTAGVAVALPFETRKELSLFEPRVTVQPLIYVGISSSGTAIANVIDFRVYYEVIKMTELDYLRLLAGGG